MYKTIRHGENSLQYTILPQNDDFRMDGKLSSNSSSSNGHKPKRGRRRSFFAYLGLLFVCTVIIGAILIPFLVSAECLPNPSDWFIRTKIIEREKSISNNQSLTSTISKINSNNKNLNKNDSTIKAYLIDNNNSNNNINQNNIPSTEILSTAKSDDDVITSDSIYTNQEQLSQLQQLQKQQQQAADNFGNNVAALGPTLTNAIDDGGIRSTDAKIDSQTSSTPKGTTIKARLETSTQLLTTLQITSTTTTSTTTTTTVLPLVSTSSKKPIILPVLAKTNSVIRENGKLVDRPAEPKNWIRSHWPFIDPSTYFQWAGYKSEDSVLLPAILGVALIGMILIITLCSVARNKKTIVASVRKRNRNDVEEAGEDNTTLLTTGYLSDED